MIPRFIETSDFYFSLFAMIGLLFFVAAPLQWLVNYYLDLKGGIAFCFALALIAALGRLFLYQFGMSMGSVGGNVGFTDAGLWSVFMSTFIISLVLTLFMNYGVYHLVQFRKTGEFDKLLFFSWLAISLGAPAMSIAIKELNSYQTEKNFQENFVRTNLEIFHYSELPIHIDELKFVNSTNGRKSKVFGIFVSKFYADDELEANSFRKQVPTEDHVLLDQRQDIPLGVDHFVLSWYSFVEDQYYSDTFSFPSEAFPVESQPDGSKSMMGLDLLIQAGGKVKLYDGRRKQFIPYTKVAVKPLEKEKKEHKLNALYNSTRTFESRKALGESLRKIRDSGLLEKRMEMEEQEFSWRLTFEGSGEISSVEIKEFCYLRYKTTYSRLHQTCKKALPGKISLHFKRQEQQKTPSFYLTIHKKSLYRAIEELVQGNMETAVEFHLKTSADQPNRVIFLIRANGQTLEFDEFEQKVVLT